MHMLGQAVICGIPVLGHVGIGQELCGRQISLIDAVFQCHLGK